MPHFICRWPGGDVLLASVESRQELDAILQERCEPGVCKVARYHGPLVLELKPDVPGVPRASAEQFNPRPACPAFQPAWSNRASSGDVGLFARDGSSQRVHKLVLQCRLPVLHGQPVAAQVQQVRLSCIPDGSCLFSVVHFLYLDDILQQEQLTPQLHQTAVACGLQRLVQLCEAQFAQQLELQLTSWPGLCESQREGVLDSFIGWAAYAEQLGRQALQQMCIHALARHLAAAQARPSWSSLSSSSTSLARLIAASTAPPLVHRQVTPDGSAVLPVPSNPAPATAAGSGAGPTVSVDAEALAAAGGRLTSAEWLQLQNYRTAVTESLKFPAACPISIQQQQVNSSRPASASSPLIQFTVKQPVLGPHKRLMDSVLRFAFPATHTLLSSGWNISSVATGNVQTSNSSINSVSQAAAAATVATPTAASAAAASRAALFVSVGQQQSTGNLLDRPLTPTAAAGAAPLSATPSGQVMEGSSQTLAQVPMPVPISAPVAAESAADPQSQQPAGPATTAVAEDGPSTVEESHAPAAASASAAGVLCEHASIRSSHTGGTAGHQTIAGTSSAAPGSVPDSSAVGVPAGRHLRIRVLSAGGAGAVARRSSHIGRLRSDLRQSWGSGISLPATEGLEQQPQSLAGAFSAVQGAAVSPHLQRVLLEPGGLSTWGSGTVSRQSSFHSSQQQLISTEQIPVQQHHRQQQVVHLSHLSIRTTQQLYETGVRPMQQDRSGNQRESEQSDNMQDELHGLGSVGQEVEQWQQQHASSAEDSGSGLLHSDYGTYDSSVLELPAHTAGTAVDGGVHQPQEPAGEFETVAATTAACDTPQLRLIATCLPSATGSMPYSTAALQRTLVEDFVLYEEASAARQHVVGILVAVEQGDVIAGQRLLAPACAELVAATAPSPAINKLAAFATAPGAGAAVVSGTEAAASAALRAAGEYLRSVAGISKLLGMASSSRAALEPSATQQQLQQQQLIRALQRLARHLPGLSRLLANHPIASTMMAAAGGASLQGASAAAEPATAAALTESNSTGSDLNAAIADLVQLPELLQGLQFSVLLTQEQFTQRQQQLQQLATHAAAMLSQQAREVSQPAEGAAADAAAAAAAGRPVPSAVSASPSPVSASEASQMRERGFQAGLLFSSILASLGTYGAAAPQSQGSRLGPGAVQFSSMGFGVAPVMHGPGAVLLGYPYSGPAGAATTAGGGAGGIAGMFTPTGVGALLAGGLLAEGGVAGDSILEDTAADVLMHGAGARRITCNGLYELCATLARPSGSPTHQGLSAVGQHAGENPIDGQNLTSLSGHKRRLSSAEEQQSAAKR